MLSGWGKNSRLRLTGAVKKGMTVKHLFILSNMQGLDPEPSFIPTLQHAFPNDEIIMVKETLCAKKFYAGCYREKTLTPWVVGSALRKSHTAECYSLKKQAILFIVLDFL